MPTTRRDPAAPHWLVQLLRSKPERVPWTRALRAPVALAVPLAVAFALGDIGLGALVSTGALPTVLADSAGPYRYRARRLASATAAAGTGYLIGLLTGGVPAWSVPAVIVVAAVSALVSAAGSTASVSGLQFFVFCVLGTGQHVTGARIEVALGCFLLGAAWGLAVALAGWTVHATSPERTAVVQVYIELATMLSATDPAVSRAARHQLTTAMNTAYDRLLTARSWLSGRDATYRELLNLLSASTPVVEASVAMLNAGQRAPAEAVDYLARVATAVHANHPLPPAPEGDLPLHAGLARIHEGDERQRRAPEPLRTRAAEWARSLVAGPLTWIATARLVLCVALAETASLLLPLERSYWVTLTVGIVLKPDFGSVFGRAVLRGVGTVIGVGIGAAVLGTGVRGWVLVVLIAVFATGVAIGKVRNYGVLSAFVTPLIIVQTDLAANGNWSVVLARLVDTVLGCVIVLVFGYLLWPGSRRPQIGGLLAETLDRVGEYLAVALAPELAEPPGPDAAVIDSPVTEPVARSRARRRAYRGLSDLRTAFQQVVVEPSAAGRQVTAWWPVIVALERTTDAVTEVVVTVQHGAPAPATADVRLLTEAVAELAAAVREQREPVDPPLPETRQLSGVVERLGSAFDAIRGPDLSGQSPMRFVRRLLPRRARGHTPG